MPMKSLDNEQNLSKTFELLGALLAQRTSGHVSLVICGGSALIALGLIPRATQDVDIVALLDRGKLVSSVPLPEALVESGRLVAQEMALPAAWLNAGPASIFNETLPNQGFPNGFQSRLTHRDFGPVLSIYFVSRLDQVYFKFYAAVDQGGPSPHLTDLMSLNPTDQELRSAVEWAQLHDTSEEFMETVRQMLRSMERKNVVPGV
jgi:hypothetical protein